MATIFSDRIFENDELFDELLGFLGSAKDSNLIRLYTLKFKEKGNSYYGQKDFVNAIICYVKATDIFSLAFSLEVEDERLFSDLAVQLNLNLAVCSLKLQDYEDAVKYCSLVLNIDPHNVKAFFRRAMALVKLDRLLEAHSDLIMAQKFEPGNKEVKKELANVEDSLKSSKSRNGPKGLAGASLLGDRRKSKGCKEKMDLEDTLHNPPKIEIEISCQQSRDSNQGPMEWKLGDNDLASVSSNSVCEMTDHDLGPSCSGPDNCVEPPVVNKDIAKSMLRFVNRRKRDFLLKISAAQYNQLVEGKEASFYHPVLKSVLKVRVLRSRSKVSEAREWPGNSTGENAEQHIKNCEVKNTLFHSEQTSLVEDDPKFQDCMDEDPITKKDDERRDENSQFNLMSHETLFQFSSRPKARKRSTIVSLTSGDPPLGGKRFRRQQGTSMILPGKNRLISNRIYACRYYCGRKRKISPARLDQDSARSKKNKASLFTVHVNSVVSCSVSVLEDTNSCN